MTLGAADEYYRHCITKMAAVHFPSCADSAARLVRMGEAPETVLCVGGLGDENIRTLPKMSREELCNSTGFPLQQPFALVTYHPETSADAGSPAAQSEALCAAMEAVPGVYWLITGSNADAGGQICTARMRRFAAEHSDRAGFIQSLGLRRYLSAMQYAALAASGSAVSSFISRDTNGYKLIGVFDINPELCGKEMLCMLGTEKPHWFLRYPPNSSDTFSAEFTRRHNNANALCLGGRVVGAGLACQIVDAFLNAEFEGGRHQKRGRRWWYR